MSGTTLTKDSGSAVDAVFQRDAWLLGNEMVPNFEKALSPERVNWYRNNKREYIPALQRGFPLPWEITASVVPVEAAGYAIEETDCFPWLGHMERFAKEYFKTEIVLRDKFPIPARLPFKNVLPIFDPGLSNREMVDKALKAQGLRVEGTDVSKFTGADSEGPRLWLIERSPQPMAARGLPPKFAKQYFEGRQTRPLNLRGYGIGTGLLYKVEKRFLDPDAVTASWFPENLLLPDGFVAYGYYDPTYGKVWFYSRDAGYEFGTMAFREAILLLPT